MIKRTPLALVGLASLATACGGGGGTASSSAAPAIPATTAPAALITSASAHSVAPATIAAPARTSAVPTSTAVVLLTPFTPSGPAAGIRITFRSPGSCTSSNVDTGNAQAYRCSLTKAEAGGVNLEDPCFADPINPGQPLLCLSGPDAKEATAVTSTGELEPVQAIPSADPWVVQLADGQECGTIGGATYTLNGQRANYGCDKGGTLFGSPVTSVALWTIMYQAKGATSASMVPIIRAWS